MTSTAQNAPPYETILQIIRMWPAAQRLALVQDILTSFVPQAHPVPARRSPTLHQALSLVASADPAPSDDDVAHWLDERRQERYGL